MASNADRHVIIQSRSHSSISIPVTAGPGTHLAVERQILLFRIAGRENSSVPHRQRPRPQRILPVHADAAEDTEIRYLERQNTETFVLPVAGGILQEGMPRQQGGEMSGVFRPVLEVLPPAVRRDDLPVKDETSARWTYLHRVSSVQKKTYLCFSTILIKKKPKKLYIIFIYYN